MHKRGGRRVSAPQAKEQEAGADAGARGPGCNAAANERSEARNGQAWYVYGAESRTCNDESQKQHAAGAARYL